MSRAERIHSWRRRHLLLTDCAAFAVTGLDLCLAASLSWGFDFYFIRRRIIHKYMICQFVRLPDEPKIRVKSGLATLLSFYYDHKSQSWNTWVPHRCHLVWRWCWHNLCVLVRARTCVPVREKRKTSKKDFQTASQKQQPHRPFLRSHVPIRAWPRSSHIAVTIIHNLVLMANY